MPRGYLDPDRRARIAHAVIEVVARKGMSGVTHRAVADAAGVPLGSTTYHFSSKDDLLLAAVEEAKASSDGYLAEWEAGVRSDETLAAALARLLAELTGPNRDRVVVEQELYVAALRSPALRTVSLAWDDALPATLSRHTDSITAQALAMAADGLVARALIRGTPITVAEAEPLLRRIMR